MMKNLWLIGVLMLAIGWWFSDVLPAPQHLKNVTHLNPVQTEIVPEKSSVSAHGVMYHVEAVADYKISGLVVSDMKTDAWNAKHASWNEYFNVMDVCMVFGDNAQDGAYQDMTFRSGQWTCFVNVKSDLANQSKYLHSLSNTHVVTADADLAKRMRSVRVGDQISMTGKLVNYSHTQNGGRMSSLSRTDTGNGACEILMLSRLEVLQAAPIWPKLLRYLGVVMLLISWCSFFLTPYRSIA